jgi:hypothetical protein
VIQYLKKHSAVQVDYSINMAALLSTPYGAAVADPLDSAPHSGDEIRSMSIIDPLPSVPR